VHDVRFLDKQVDQGAIIGLCIKGARAKRMIKQGSAFVIR